MATRKTAKGDQDDDLVRKIRKTVEEHGAAETPKPAEAGPPAPGEASEALKQTVRKPKKAAARKTSAKATESEATVKPAKATRKSAKSASEAPPAEKKTAARRTRTKPAVEESAPPPIVASSQAQPPLQAQGAPQGSPEESAPQTQPWQASQGEREADMTNKPEPTPTSSDAPDLSHVALSAWPTSPGMGAPAGPPPPAPYDPYADQRPLPGQYGRTRLTLLVRDPEWIFAYWEVSDEDRNRFGLEGFNHGRRMALRVYDVTGTNAVERANRYYDIVVTEYATSWYLHVGQPNRSWSVDLGIYDENGNFIPIARSNMVSTPRDRLSEVIDEQWMAVDEERFQRLMRMSVGPGLMGASEMLGIEVGQKLFPQYLPGASEMFALGSSERLGASEQIRGVEEKAPFHLQVRYELIVYGSTEPDATVRLCGEVIRLRPDGSFTVRYELPDGERTIDVHATKSTGDQWRQVSSHITKETH